MLICKKLMEFYLKKRLTELIVKFGLKSFAAKMYEIFKMNFGDDQKRF